MTTQQVMANGQPMPSIERRAKEMQTDIDAAKERLLSMPLDMLATCPCVVGSRCCSENCSCRYPFRSGGCRCCAGYGSDEQREAAANKLLALALSQPAKRLKGLVWVLVNDYPNGSVSPTYEANTIFGTYRVSGAGRGYGGTEGARLCWIWAVSSFVHRPRQATVRGRLRRPRQRTV